MNYLIYEPNKIVVYTVGWPIKLAKIEPNSFFGEYNNRPIKKDIMKKLLFKKSMTFLEFERVKDVLREW